MHRTDRTARAVCGLLCQDHGSADDVVREQLKREWGRVSVENQQSKYEVDIVALQATVRSEFEVCVYVCCLVICLFDTMAA